MLTVSFPGPLTLSKTFGLPAGRQAVGGRLYAQETQTHGGELQHSD